MLETNWRLIGFLQYQKTAATAIANHTKRSKNTELPRSSDPTRIKVDLSRPVCKRFALSSTWEKKSLLPTHCLYKWLLHRSNTLSSPCQQSIQSEVHNWRFASLWCLILWILPHWKIWSLKSGAKKEYLHRHSHLNSPLLIKKYNSCWIHKSHCHNHLQLHCNCHQ